MVFLGSGLARYYPLSEAQVNDIRATGSKDITPHFPSPDPNLISSTSSPHSSSPKPELPALTKLQPPSSFFITHLTCNEQPMPRSTPKSTPAYSTMDDFNSYDVPSPSYYMYGGEGDQYLDSNTSESQSPSSSLVSCNLPARRPGTNVYESELTSKSVRYVNGRRLQRHL